MIFQKEKHMTKKVEETDKSKKKVIRSTKFFVTQEVYNNRWAWGRKLVKRFDANENNYTDSVISVDEIINHMIDFLKRAGLEVTKIAGIEHNEDTQEVWNDRVSDYVKEPKHVHVHIYVEIENRTTLDKFAKIVGVEPQFVETPKRGKYGTENILAYLIHAKDPSKYQYDPKSVISYGFDYLDYWAHHKKSWEEGRAKKSRSQAMVKVDWLEEQVQIGAIDKRQIMLSDDLQKIYSKNMRRINDAIQFYTEKKAFETIEALDRGEFEMGVYFFTGSPRAGKSTLAKSFIAKLLQEHPSWRSYASAGNNPMDDYTSEEIIFFDDLRSSSMRATDWLKVLDNHQSTPLGARYHNKQKASRVIIITSYLDPITFFSMVKGSGGADEALTQFIGRLSYIAHVIRADDFFSRTYRLDEVVQSPDEKEFPVKFSDETVTKKTKFYPEMVADNTTPEEILQHLLEDVRKRNDSSFDHRFHEARLATEIVDGQKRSEMEHNIETQKGQSGYFDEYGRQISDTNGNEIYYPKYDDPFAD